MREQAEFLLLAVLFLRNTLRPKFHPRCLNSLLLMAHNVRLDTSLHRTQR